MLVLDHIAVAAETLAEGAAHVGAALGVELSGIGLHDRMGTHNRLLSLGPGLYLEVIAINPDAKPPAQARWFDLDRFTGHPRLTNWIVRTGDLASALAEAPPGMGVPISFARGDYLWQMGVPPDGKLPFDGAAPALIEWESPLHPAERLPDLGCRLVQLTVEHPEAEAILSAYPPLGHVEGVRVVTGPVKRLWAEIDTPSGRTFLS
jgi:hypothetical protein